MTAGLGEIGLLGTVLSALGRSAALGRGGVGVIVASSGCGFSFDPKQIEKNGKRIGLDGRGRLSRQSWLSLSCAVPNSDKVASRHVMSTGCVRLCEDVRRR